MTVPHGKTDGSGSTSSREVRHLCAENRQARALLARWLKWEGDIAGMGTPVRGTKSWLIKITREFLDPPAGGAR